MTEANIWRTPAPARQLVSVHAARPDLSTIDAAPKTARPKSSKSQPRTKHSRETKPEVLIKCRTPAVLSQRASSSSPPLGTTKRAHTTTPNHTPQARTRHGHDHGPTVTDSILTRYHSLYTDTSGRGSRAALHGRAQATFLNTFSDGKATPRICHEAISP